MTIIRTPKAESEPSDQSSVQVARDHGRQAVVMTRASLVMFCVTWGGMWGPVYLGLPALLHLYPVFFVMLLLTIVFAGIALRYARLAIRGYEGRSPYSVVWSILGAITMLLLPLPAVWFGDMPLAFFAG